MKTLLILLGFAVSTTAACTSQPQPIDPGLRVGRQADGSAVVPTGQALRPWGRTLEFGGRPVDLAMASGGSALYLKDDRGLVVVDPVTWSLRQELAVGEDGTSMFGLAVSGDGRAVYVTTATNALREARVGANGILTWDGESPSPALRGTIAPFRAASRSPGTGNALGFVSRGTTASPRWISRKDACSTKSRWEWHPTRSS